MLMPNEALQATAKNGPRLSANSLASEVASRVTQRLRYPWGCAGLSLHGVLRERGSPEAAISQKGVVYPGHRETNSVGAPGEQSLSLLGREGRFLRVITLEDRVTIHNAFPDRRFKP